MGFDFQMKGFSTFKTEIEICSHFKRVVAWRGAAEEECRRRKRRVSVRYLFGVFSRRGKVVHRGRRRRRRFEQMDSEQFEVLRNAV